MKISYFQVQDEKTIKSVNELMQKELVGKTALKVVKVVRKLEELHKDVTKSIEIIRNKYVVKDENGNPVHPEEDGVVKTDVIKISDPIEFNKEITEILSEEVEFFPDMEKITEKEIENVNISASSLAVLDWLIEIN
jgi:hypothetical protein